MDRRADIFSVGVMMWEAIARRRLTAGDTEGAILHKRTHGTQLRIREVVPDVPERLAQICDRAMALDQNERYGTAAELQAELEGYLDGASLRASDREIGALTSKAFEVERGRIRDVIEQQLATVAKLGTGSYPSVLPSLGRVEVPSSLRNPTQSQPPLENAIPVHTSSPPPGTAPNGAPAFTVTNPRQRIPRAPAIIASVLLIGGIATGVAVLVSQRSTTPVVVSATAAQTVPTALAGNGTAHDATGITLAITATPTNAKLTLDGIALAGNPYRGAIPRDSVPHTLVVSAPGYVTDTRKVAFDADVSTDVQLEPMFVGNGSFGRPTATAVTPSTGLTPSTTATTTTKAEPGGAGSDIAKDPKQHHGIDEKDPY